MLGKEFNDDLRFVSEFEIEHGGVEADGSPLDGEVEIEQAFIEYDVTENAQVRGGVFLMPTGILNETHEPPTFYGVGSEMGLKALSSLPLGGKQVWVLHYIQIMDSLLMQL